MTEIAFYVGSYSIASPWAGAPGAHGMGIVRAAIDVATGSIRIGGHTPELNPSFLVRNSRRGRLLAITEPQRAGDAVCFEESAAGALTERGRIATGADAPCHISIDEDRDLAFVSHYHGGALALLALGEKGEPLSRLELAVQPELMGGEDPAAARSRVHASLPLSGGELLVADTGRDLVLLYEIAGLGSTASLRLRDALRLPAGAGPRHLALHPGSGAVYVSNQNSGGVSVVARVAGDHGTRLELRGGSRSTGLGRDKCAPSEIAAHPIWDVVYMANRGDNSLSIFTVESPSGELALCASVDCGGVNPRHFAVSPDGLWLVVANQDSDELSLFRVEDRGRRLTPANRRFRTATPTAICF